jgi:hypothetical protein
MYAVRGDTIQYTNKTTVESQFTGVVDDNPKKSRVSPATGANAIQLLSTQSKAPKVPP